jgi:hypothetical protein
VHQVGDQPRFCDDARSTNHQNNEPISPSALFGGNVWQHSQNPTLHTFLIASQEILHTYGCASFCVTDCDVYSRNGSSPPKKKNPTEHTGIWAEFLAWYDGPLWIRASSLSRLQIHIHRHTTLGRRPSDEWLARRRDLYLITLKAHKRQISMAPAGFKPAIRNPSKRAAAHLSCRPRCQWDRKSYSDNRFKSIRFKTVAKWVWHLNAT